MSKWDSLKSNKFLSERYRIYMNKHGNMYNDEIKRILDQNFIDNIGNRQIYSVFTQLYDRFGAFREDENYYVEHLNKIKNIFNIDCNVIEIGAGCCPTFASRIAREQFKINRGTITVYDPNLIIGSVDKYENMKLCKTSFEYDTDISKYDLVVGIMPCLCTNNIIEALSNNPKDFYIAFCGCDHFAFENNYYQYGFFRPSYNDNIEMLQKIVEDNNMGELVIDYLDNKYEVDYPIAYNKKTR